MELNEYVEFQTTQMKEPVFGVVDAIREFKSEYGWHLYRVVLMDKTVRWAFPDELNPAY